MGVSYKGYSGRREENRQKVEKYFQNREKWKERVEGDDGYTGNVVERSKGGKTKRRRDDLQSETDLLL